ncbi:LysR family transcriptional regulator [Rhodococcus koreensis]
MDFKQIEYFRAVVEAGSVSGAAKRLGLTQPPVSTAISRIERELGVRLLERTPKGVHPTDAGLHLLKVGGRLISDRTNLCRTLAMMGEGLVGHLRIGAEPMVIDAFVADALSDFTIDAPDVHISLTDGSPDLIVKGIFSGEYDMGCLPFFTEQFRSVVTEYCDYLEVGAFPISLAVPRRRSREDHPGGVGWGRWIVPHRLTMFYGFPDAAEQALAEVDETYSTIEVSTPQTSAALVAAGLGVALMTEQMAKWHPGIALVSAPPWVPSLGATLFWRRGAEVTPLMQRWIEAVRESFPWQLEGPGRAIHKSM